MVHLAEHSYNAAVVNTGNQNRKEVIEERRMLLQVKCESLIVAVGVG